MMTIKVKESQRITKAAKNQCTYEIEIENNADYGYGGVQFGEGKTKSQVLLSLVMIFSSVILLLPPLFHPPFRGIGVVSWKDGNVRTKGRQIMSEHARDNI